MAELVFSTDVFRPLGRPMPGVPILLDGDMRLVEPACAWLLHIALVRGRIRSPQTWRAYGEGLRPGGQPYAEFRATDPCPHRLTLGRSRIIPSRRQRLEVARHTRLGQGCLRPVPSMARVRS